VTAAPGTAGVTVKTVSVGQGGAAGFSAGVPAENGSPVTLPVTLTAGQTLSVPVTFSPAAPGGVTGSVGFVTDAAHFPVIASA